MNLKMLLPDSTAIQIEDASLSGVIVMSLDSKESLMEVWGKLTPDNLHEVQLKQDDAVVRTLHGVVVDSLQMVPNPDGTLTAHFYIHETITGNVTTDAEYIAAGKILLGEEI